MKKNSIQFADADFLEIRGTSSYKGYVRSTASALSKIFGKPIPGYDDKTVFQWLKKFGSIVFTIYDYKEYRTIGPRTEVEYHIGTKCPEDTGVIVGLLMAQGFNAYIEK